MNNKILLMLMTLLLLVSCSSSENVKLSANEAGERLINEDVILLDVRTQTEHDDEHIEGSVLLPIDDIGDDTLNVLTDKDAVIFVYCRSGSRSKKATNKLIELGYKNVFDIGGIVDLKDNEYFTDKVIRE